MQLLPVPSKNWLLYPIAPTFQLPKDTRDLLLTHKLQILQHITNITWISVHATFVLSHY